MILGIIGVGKFVRTLWTLVVDTAMMSRTPVLIVTVGYPVPVYQVSYVALGDTFSLPSTMKLVGPL